MIENEYVYIYVAGVSYSIDEQSLTEIFSKYGQVVDGRLSDSLLSFVFYTFFLLFGVRGGVPNEILLSSFVLIQLSINCYFLLNLIFL